VGENTTIKKRSREKRTECVISAEAGIIEAAGEQRVVFQEIPAFAGMTGEQE